MAQQSGTVIRSNDGSLFFIRQEVLEACRVAADEVSDTERMLDAEGDVAGFATSTGPIASITPVRFDNPNLQPLSQQSVADQVKNLGKTMSTIMCCW